MAITHLTSSDFEAWNQWARTHTFPECFVQTSVWPGEFFIVAARDENGNIAEGARVDTRDLWLGKKMWWIRKKITADNGQLTTPKTEILLSYLIEKARRANVIFIRIQSDQLISLSAYHLISPRFLFHVVDPEHSLMVDVRVAEDELLTAMHQKTRYNIRYAEKQGVTVRKGSLDEFMSLYQATNKRKKIRGYSRVYVESILKLPAPLSTHILIAHHNGTPLAAHLLVQFGSTTTYLFGGSSDASRNLMAPHLLHWESMRQARRNGCAWYDFGGISDENPSWRDITRFKRGFVSRETGREITHGKTYDIILNPRWYRLFANVRKIF